MSCETIRYACKHGENDEIIHLDASSQVHLEFHLLCFSRTGFTQIVLLFIIGPLGILLSKLESIFSYNFLMSSLPLATRWSTSVLYRWYNAGKVWAHKNPVEVLALELPQDLSFVIKIAKKRIMYQEEFLQILSTRNVVKNRHSICQFVMDCQSHFSEGVFRDDDFWDPWWGSAIRNCI